LAGAFFVAAFTAGLEAGFDPLVAVLEAVFVETFVAALAGLAGTLAVGLAVLVAAFVAGFFVSGFALAAVAFVLVVGAFGDEDLIAFPLVDFFGDVSLTTATFLTAAAGVLSDLEAIRTFGV
jgi:hypothetical protein